MKDCCAKEINLEKLLKDNSIRATKSKTDTLNLFLESKVPLGSKDILHSLSEYNESTIFRNLTTFKNLNILEEIDLNEGYKRYTLKQLDHHHHYAKCTRCEDIIKIDTCSILPIQKELKKKSFKVEAHKIEVFGKCSNCL